MVAATTSATAGSSGSPWSMVRSRLLYTSFGSRWCMRVREKMSAPKMLSIRSAGTGPPATGRAGVVTCAWTSEVKGGRERRQDNRVGGGWGAWWFPTFLLGLCGCSPRRHGGHGVLRPPFNLLSCPVGGGQEFLVGPALSPPKYR